MLANADQEFADRGTAQVINGWPGRASLVHRYLGQPAQVLTPK